MSDAPLEILLVEDNPGDARLVMIALEDAAPGHFRVTHVERLAPALEQIASHRFDAVLLDLSLPDSFGLENVGRVAGAAPDTPVIVLTGSHEDTLGPTFLRWGAHDYLVKDRADGYTLQRALFYAIERAGLMAEIRALSLTDPLTRLCNRRGFLVLAEQHHRLAARTRQTFLVVVVDLDGLKPINDQHGHEAGDEIIARAADCLRASTRQADIVARMGGDEFTILFAGAREGDAVDLVERIRGAVDDANQASPRPYRLGLSIGSAAFDPQRPRSLAELTSEADQAMYRQKVERKAARR